MRLLVLLIGLSALCAGGDAQAEDKVDLPRSTTADLDSPLRWNRNGQRRFTLNVLREQVCFKGLWTGGLAGSMQSTAARASMDTLLQTLVKMTAERGLDAVSKEGVPTMPILFYAGRKQPWRIIHNVIRAVREAKYPYRRYQISFTDGEQERLIECFESDQTQVDGVVTIPVAADASVEQVASAIDRTRETGARDFVLDGRRYTYAPRQRPFQFAPNANGNGNLTAFLSVPEGAKNPPVLVSVVHANSLETHSPAWHRIAVRGFAFATVVVQSSEHAAFPLQVHQARAAIRWLRAHSSQYGYDASRIGIIGVGNAGHIAALVGTTDGVEELKGALGAHTKHSSRVQAVLHVAGWSDFTGGAAALLGGTREHQVQHAKMASPMTHASKGDAPFLIIASDVESGSRKHSGGLHSALRQADVESTYHLVKSTASVDALESEELLSVIVAFFDKHLKPTPIVPKTGR